MISRIENALVERLQLGLGKLARRVESYGGELDDPKLNLLNLPAVLVTYGGSRFERMGVSARSYRIKASDKFIVIVLVRSLRSEKAGRHGGVTEREIGANQLISAVKRLLINQTLGQLVEPIEIAEVRALFNQAPVQNSALTAYAIEFDIRYSQSDFLDDGKFPEPTADINSPDYLFNRYQGKLSAPDAELRTLEGKLFDPTNAAQVPFEIETKEKT
ncbi:DUF1834 family protein [Pasteurellaceae bacterium HPA106]|nr:DUF1834 family protein [Spirabiliibacterium pneumoniae]